MLLLTPDLRRHSLHKVPHRDRSCTDARKCALCVSFCNVHRFSYTLFNEAPIIDAFAAQLGFYMQRAYHCCKAMQMSENPESKTDKPQNRLTSIRVQKQTVELLKERGRKGESYDDIIKRLLEKRRR